jgi:hypothetical protein
MSASWSWAGTWLNTMVPFSTLSLKKWYLTSMCLVLEWSTGFFCYAYGTGAITKKWDLGALLTKVSLGVWDPQQLGTTTRGCNILHLGGRMSYTRLLVGRPRNQRGPKKLARTRSRLRLDSATSEIRIRKTMKWKSRVGWIPKAKSRGRL